MRSVLRKYYKVHVPFSQPRFILNPSSYALSSSRSSIPLHHGIHLNLAHPELCFDTEWRSSCPSLDIGPLHQARHKRRKRSWTDHLDLCRERDHLRPRLDKIRLLSDRPLTRRDRVGRNVGLCNQYWHGTRHRAGVPELDDGWHNDRRPSRR